MCVGPTKWVRPGASTFQTHMNFLSWHYCPSEKRPDGCPDMALTQKGVHIHSMSPDPRVKQEIPEPPQIKVEPEEQSIKQEEEQLQVCVPESSGVCVKTEESSLLQQRQTEHKEETQGVDISSEPHFHSETEGDTEHSSDMDNDEDWRAPFSCSAAQIETLSSKYKSAPEMSDAVNNGDMSGTAEGDERKKHGSKQDLHKHIRIHTAEKPFSCSICNKAFTRKSNLAVHIKIHTGDKPYGCSMCEKAFTVKSNLTVHMRTHTGEKLFSCPICKKDLNHSSTYKYHLRRHINEKPYSCSICKRTFTQKTCLEVHMRTHT